MDPQKRRFNDRIAFSPKGNILAVNKGTHVELWTVLQRGTDILSPAHNQIGELLDVFLLPSGDIYGSGQLSFSSDGNKIAATNGGNVVIWDISQSRELRRLSSPKMNNIDDAVFFTDVAFSFESDYLAVAAETGVYLCSVQSLND